MTEQEYIDATNLTKLRIMLTLMRDTLPTRKEDEQMEAAIRHLLRRWIDHLESVVQCDPQFAPYDVTCARCKKVVSCVDAMVEEGDRWECYQCWTEENAAEAERSKIPPFTVISAPPKRGRKTKK